jgi:hypothetical protein
MAGDRMPRRADTTPAAASQPSTRERSGAAGKISDPPDWRFVDAIAALEAVRPLEPADPALDRFPRPADGLLA